MKLLPLFSFLFGSVAVAAGGQVGEQLDFEVGPADEPAAYTWNEALEVCEGKGMELPSLEEMAAIYCHAKLDDKKISAKHPQPDGGCKASGTSQTLPNFKARGQYWTSSQYNRGVVQYIDFLDGSLGYYGKSERLNVRCILPEEGRSEKGSVVPYDINDVDRHSFHDIIDTIAGIYETEFRASGKRLIIRKNWRDQEENARSWFMEENDRKRHRVRQVREIELVGGLARHPMLNRDAYALIVCHEIGHHLGGAPFSLGYSSEGQSDYFAAARCMKRYLRLARYEQPYDEPLPEALAQRCAASYSDADEQRLCRRNIRAGLTLSRWIAHTRDAEPTRLTRRDPSERSQTLVHGYPSPQCRLDTLVAGALCPIDERRPFSYDDPRDGACTRESGYEREARPRCWFNIEVADAAEN